MSESTLVKMPYFWKSHVKAHLWAGGLDLDTYGAFTVQT